MAGGVEDQPGGIFGLCRLLGEHGEAVEYDLLIAGYRLDWLGSDRLDWRDLLVFVKHSPRTSALARTLLGEAAGWGVEAHLLATAVDALAAGNWQRSGKKGAPRPKPVPRPRANTPLLVKGTPRSLDELDARLGYSPRTP